MSIKPAYRPDIDGLRAAAVLSVVLYHYGATWLPGGFTGVDVFFVISGYLITTILHKEIEAGEFSLLAFYDRRVRRIMPALFVVLATTLLLGWFILMPGDYASLGGSAAWAAAGLGNLYFFQNTGYFDQTAEMQPLLHTWSLGVEEQFYVVWPIALLISLKLIRSSRLFVGLFIVAVAFAFAYAERRMGYDPKGAFYLPHPRVWELSLGALLAFLPAIRSAIVSQLVGLAGLALIAWSMTVISAADPFPGHNAIYACAGAALITWPKATSAVAALLSLRPMVAIGRISYSLYLWHWPVLAFFRYYANDAMPSGTETAILGIMSIGLAYLSWRFVEETFRRPFLVPCHSVAVGAASIIIVASAGIAVLQTKGLPQRFPLDVQQVLAMETYDFRTDARYPACWLDDNAEPSALAAECVAPVGASTALTVAVWGDSHAARLYPGLRNVLPETVGVTQYTRNSCPPIAGAVRPACSAGNEAVLRALAANPPDFLVLYGAWPNYGSWGDGSTLPNELGETIASIKAQGVKNIILVGPAPIFRPTLPAMVVEYWNEHRKMPDRLPGDPDGSVTSADQALRAVAAAANIEYFSPVQILCNDGGCRTHTELSSTDLVTWDYGHLTTSGAEMLVREMTRNLRLDAANHRGGHQWR